MVFSLCSCKSAAALLMHTMTISVHSFTKMEAFKRSQIEVGHAPVKVTVNQLTNKIYVINRDSNTVGVIDSNSGNVTTCSLNKQDLCG